MPKSKKNALAVPTTLTSEVGVDKEDLVAIKVAKVETHLIQQQAEQDALLRDLKKKLKASQEDLAKTKEKAGEAVYDTAEAKKALKALGLKVSFSVTAKVDKKKLVVEVGLRQEACSRQPSWTPISSTKEVAIPKAVKTAQKAVEDLEADIEECQIKLVDIRKRLSQISTLERQAKAAVAIRVLETSQEGRDLLAAIEEGEGLPEIPGLPSPE